MLEINIPQVVVEVSAQFALYERALVSNDVSTLNELFWATPHTIRYDISENVYGHAEISAFRRTCKLRGHHHLTRTSTITVRLVIRWCNALGSVREREFTIAGKTAT